MNTEQFDKHLHAELTQAVKDAQAVLQVLAAADTSATEPLELLLQLQGRLEQMTPVMVRRTKHRGASWEQIGKRLGLNQDTVRKKYADPVVQRALNRPRPPAPSTPTPPQPRPAPRQPRPTASTSRLEDLLTAFNDTLSRADLPVPTEHRRLTTIPASLRRFLAAPIPALTPWTGR
ncbi:hypothetical protein [Streptomyces sp. NPDC000880]